MQEIAEVIALADTAPDRLEAVKEVQRRIADYEAELRERHDAETSEMAKLQGELSVAEAALRNASLATQRILSEVPMRFRMAAESAAEAVRAYAGDVTRARRDHDAAQEMLDRRQKDERPKLGKEEQKALMEQVTRMALALQKTMARQQELIADQEAAETVIAGEIARIRKTHS